ncbi:MAG: hypothetical protein GKR91_10365 [Pseudomonadales bacterium]|nr:hypothetical protein [Pseudomonadales bacterium]
MNTSLTSLSYLIICMLSRKPQSGYALCQSIKNMPIGAVSASPGSIYPALSKLRKAKLILCKKVGGSIKPRNEYRLSAQGKRVLSGWVRQPLTGLDFIKSPELMFIRLSFLESHDSLLARQLAELSDDLNTRTSELEKYQTRAKEEMHLGGQLAITLAINITRVLQEWSEKSSKRLQK